MGDRFRNKSKVNAQNYVTSRKIQFIFLYLYKSTRNYNIGDYNKFKSFSQNMII